MTTPNEMRSGEDWMALWDLGIGHQCWDVNPDMVRDVQADALSWAAEQVKTSHSLQEALLKLSLKHQELTKGKK